ncbi:MAG TPA: hypothetical protein PKJ19_09510 [Flavobacteriales bacterium]|nr:hypothetical protein [Flavobacteriales bacterium]
MIYFIGYVIAGTITGYVANELVPTVDDDWDSPPPFLIPIACGLFWPVVIPSIMTWKLVGYIHNKLTNNKKK